MAEILQLRLSEPVRQTFARDLDGVLRLERGSDVADFLGPNPWGDLSAYRREVFDPMQSVGASIATGERPGTTIAIRVEELPRLNAVLHDLYECYAGARPWPGIDEAERAMFERLASQAGR